MYYGYKAAQILHEDRVNSLRADAQMQETQSAPGLRAALRNGWALLTKRISGSDQTSAPDHRLMEQQDCL